MENTRIIRELDTLEAVAQTGGNLDHCIVQGLDLRDPGFHWDQVSMEGAVFLGCELPPHLDACSIAGRKALFFPKVQGLPYNPYRARLYSRSELMAGWSAEFDNSLDKRIYDHFVAEGRHAAHALEALSQRLHDHAVDGAMRDLLEGRVEEGGEKRVVAIMGGHSVARTDDYYIKVVRIARKLAVAGYFIASGGGPGIMEAANLGAYLAQTSDDELEEVLVILAKAPTYHDAGYHESAQWVLDRHPRGTSSLAIPTWFYGHEPTNHFAKHVAKYFSNSLREDGLLAIAVHGVIFAPGSAGTVQEIFMDACQNHYQTFDVVSPMVFLGEERWGGESRIYEAIMHLAKGKKYATKLALVDEVEACVQAIVTQPPSR